MNFTEPRGQPNSMFNGMMNTVTAVEMKPTPNAIITADAPTTIQR